ncbi:unnamed protein product [Amoebophrya sp. A120]|nr:unnamed protein product [Amoebophrya sp. A120]|eukprot:GSA120T00012819001.1
MKYNPHATAKYLPVRRVDPISLRGKYFGIQIFQQTVIFATIAPFKMRLQAATCALLTLSFFLPARATSPFYTSTNFYLMLYKTDSCTAYRLPFYVNDSGGPVLDSKIPPGLPQLV